MINQLNWRSAVYKPSGPDSKYFKSEIWRELRRKVIKRDGNKCKACDATNELTVHHIIPRDTCHNKVELGEDIFPIEKFEEGTDWHDWVYGGKRKPQYKHILEEI